MIHINGRPLEEYVGSLRYVRGTARSARGGWRGRARPTGDAFLEPRQAEGEANARQHMAAMRPSTWGMDLIYAALDDDEYDAILEAQAGGRQ